MPNTFNVKSPRLTLKPLKIAHRAFGGYMNFKEMVLALRSGSITRLPDWPANVHLEIQDGNFYLFNGSVHVPYELEDAHRLDWMVEPTNGGTW